jgi:ketosteroid isomerase-like protein
VGVGADLWHQFETLVNKQDVVGSASVFADDGVWVSPHGRIEGREAIAAWWGQRATGVSDAQVETSMVIEDGDTAVAEWTYRDSDAAPVGPDVLGVGRARELAGVSICQVTDGKFSMMRDYYDTADRSTISA